MRSTGASISSPSPPRRAGIFGRFSLFLGFFRGAFLPFGLFALIAAGLHVGTDRLDDRLFLVLNVLDGLADRAAAAIIAEVGTWFDAAPATVSSMQYRAADLVDLGLKEAGARLGALVLELVADLILALPVFLYHKTPPPLRELVTTSRRSLRDPTVLLVAGPAAAITAGLAGAFVVTREAQVLVHSLVSSTGLRADLCLFASTTGGFLALALITWRLGPVLFAGAFTYAERRAAGDKAASVPRVKRVLRGTTTALIALPIGVLALDATPITGAVRALLWM